MSATNRGGERSAFDVYSTPAWCVHRLLERVALPGGLWLEPAAGDGSIIRAVADAGRDDVRWRAIEIRPECADGLVKLAENLYTGNFLESPLTGALPSVVITNPPYSLAQDFVMKALDYRGAIVAMLLRLNWLGSDGRANWLRTHTPDVYVLPNRPSFTGGGKTDATEYCWAVWSDAPEYRPSGRIEILNRTPLIERKETNHGDA